MDDKISKVLGLKSKSFENLSQKDKDILLKKADILKDIFKRCDKTLKELAK